MHGQFKSTLICPDCKQLSVIFDPFMMISLPIPTQEFSKFFLYFVHNSNKKLPQKVSLNVPQNMSTAEIKQKLSSITGVDEGNIVLALHQNHKLTDFVDNKANALFL
mmetsp:Transcript_9189/g.8087  ORF Transcript_9189/g.8087 Transcript_9189/m.8087 type:complete len:107 (+) Transcript_9189:608-928(+)